MTKATISSRGQIALPKAVRDRLDLRAGSEVILDVQGDSLVMRRLPNWRSMRGMLKGAGDLLQDLADEHARELDRDDDRIEGS